MNQNNTDILLESYRKKKVFRKFLGILIAFSIMLITCILIFYTYTKPLVKTAVTTRLKNTVTRGVNEVLSDELQKSKIEYNELITIMTDSQNNVTALSANMINISVMKTKFAVVTTDYLNKQKEKIFELPIGNIAGNEFFSGKGPKLKFRINPSSIVDTEIISSFKSEGINQTIHIISIKINIKTYVLLRGYKSSVDITSEIPVAQTIIVGKVPEFYVENPNSIIFPNEFK